MIEVWGEEAVRLNDERLLHKKAVDLTIDWLTAWRNQLEDDKLEYTVVEPGTLNDVPVSMVKPSQRFYAHTLAYEVQYRPEFRDWVVWGIGQFLGTVLGDDYEYIDKIVSHIRKLQEKYPEETCWTNFNLDGYTE
jgi:hypothetical protein